MKPEAKLARFRVYVGGRYVGTVYRDGDKCTAEGIKYLLVSEGGFPLSTEVRRVYDTLH